MQEKLTITQMIAEQKAILNKLKAILNDDFHFMTFHLKNRPYIKARLAEDQAKIQTEKLQSVCDLIKRFQAIRSAHCKANRETMVTVPEEPRLEDFISGKERGVEQITIAEAINRKNTYAARQRNNKFNTTFEEILSKMSNIYLTDFAGYDYCQKNMLNQINELMAAKFPADAKQSWQQDKYNEERKRLEEEMAVQTVDPKGIIKSDAIQKYNAAFQDYLATIDPLISAANSSTVVTVEY